MRTLVDVRAFPRSRRNPQFSRDVLSGTLHDAGIQYEWQGWLVARGHRVIHLLAPGRAREHAANPQEDLWQED